MASFASELGVDEEMRNSYMGQMGLTLAFGVAALGVGAGAVTAGVAAAPELGIADLADTTSFTI